MQAKRLILSLALCAFAAHFTIAAQADQLPSGITLPHCPKIPKDPNAPVPPPPPPRPALPDEAPLPAPVPPRTQPTPATYHRGALWARIGGTESWTNTVIAIVQARRADFEQARDIETFCPGYLRATQAQRDICWLRIVGAIVEFESSFKPAARPFCEGDGVYSVGLMALSTGECPDAMTIEAMMDPVKNLTCGINRMAKLIRRDHVISENNLGASAYWSTLRKPYTARLPDGRVFNLGKRDKVIERTKLFSRF